MNIEEKEYIVYRVSFPNGKCYIGITSLGIKERKRLHLNEARHSNFKFHNALKKYLSTEIWEQLDSSYDWEEIKKLEQNYIRFYDSFNAEYNSTLGGAGNLGQKHTEESKQKMRGPRPQTSIALKGKKNSEESKKKLSETRKAMNIHYSKEERIKIAISGGAKSFSVFKKDSNEFVGTWINQKQCAEELNIHPRGVTGCLNQPNKFFQHKGYTFKYIEENNYVKV